MASGKAGRLPAVARPVAASQQLAAVPAMKLGAYDYVTKPFNRDSVVLAVQRAVERRDLSRENERHRDDLEDKVTRQAGRLQGQFAEQAEAVAQAEGYRSIFPAA